MKLTQEPLELKDIASYLPYEVKVKHISGKVFVANQIRGKKFIGYDDNFEACSHIEDSKLVLRPLSDLINDIVINGVTLLPIKALDYLFGQHSEAFEEKYDMIVTDNFIKIWQGKSFFVISIDSTILDEPFRVVEKLIEWHFDVKGLIPQGKAIDMNTLNK